MCLKERVCLTIWPKFDRSFSTAHNGHEKDAKICYPFRTLHGKHVKLCSRQSIFFSPKALLTFV